MTQEPHEPEPGQDDAFFGEGPAGDATPGEYMSGDQQGGVSEDTGVVYDREGAPEATPHDAELLNDAELLSEDDDASQGLIDREADTDA